MSNGNKGGYMQAAEIWRFLPLLYDIHSYNFANAYGIDLGTMHEIQYTMPDDNIRVLFEMVGDIQHGRYD
jgi:hypothetical protein